MKTNIRLKRVMIFIDETDKHQGKSLSAAVVEKARQIGCAGATVLRGIMGFGSHRRVHTSSIVDLSINLPEIVVIMDDAEIIEKLMPELEKMVTEGLVVVDDVDAIKYTPY